MSVDPSVPPPSPLPPAETPVGATGLPRNVAAGLAVMIPLVGGIIFMILERKDRFVRFYSVQSIILGVFLAMAAILRNLAELIFRPVPLLGTPLLYLVGFIYGIFFVAWLVVYGIALSKAFMEKEWALPYIGGAAKKNSNLPPSI